MRSVKLFPLNTQKRLNDHSPVDEFIHLPLRGSDDLSDLNCVQRCTLTKIVIADEES